ncbi:MAG TPA: SHOCT domain-containing protein [Streptosporangiaceae bacterium]|nr:SHOCT domain-containing protein [Streptosporangiaceae bacterium]
MPDGSGPPGWWVAWVVFIIVIAIVSFIVKAAVLNKGGLNPFTAKEQLDVKLAQELDRRQAMPPRPSLEDRLAELDDLYRRGVISDQERHDARAKILSDGA